VTTPMLLRTLLHLAALLALPPLVLGIVNRTKSAFAGRRGPPLLQVYFDLAKLLRKGAVYSRTTSWIFRAGPIVGLAAVASAGLLLGMGGAPALVAFPGDFVLFAYLLALGRFFTALAALDTGSSFEGMGAAREVTFASLAEPALFLCFLVLARATGSISLSGMLGPPLPHAWGHAAPALVLASIGLFVVALAESSRIPVDDPATHLELTMIHEAMVLEYSGRHLAMIEWAASLKLFVYSCMGLALFFPFGIPHGADAAGVLLAVPALAAKLAVGGAALALIETVSAKMRIFRAPEFMGTAFLLAVLAMLVHSLLER
jgi:formate hydrogenlyase subunit 4